MKKLLGSILGSGLCFWTGCTTMPLAPEDWKASSSVNALAAPIGRYANTGDISNPKGKAPTLSSLLFDGRLEGFEIDNVALETTDSLGEMRIQPYVGSTPIVEERILKAERDKNKTRVWTAKTKVDYLDGYSAASSVFITGGTIMPLSSWGRYRFYIGSEGALLIHLRRRDLVDFFYFFPIPLKNEVWLRYPQYEPSDLNSDLRVDASVSKE